MSSGVLLYCKSKVYIHPTNRTSENVPGFLIVYKKLSTDPDSNSIITWCREDAFQTSPSSRSNNKKNILSQLLEADLEFAAKYQPTSTSTKNSYPTIRIDTSQLLLCSDWQIFISSVYSIQFRVPSSWWFGSIVINSKAKNIDDNIPVLFFHDDVCPSTKRIQKKMMMENFDPFNKDQDLYWGGDDFKQFLTTICDLQSVNNASSDDASSDILSSKNNARGNNIYLVNPTLEDLRNFKSNIQNLDKKPASPTSKNKSTGVYDSLNKQKWTILGKIADYTAKLTTPSYVPNLLSSYSPVLEKFLNDKYVNNLLKSSPQLQQASDDFESARVYLAKWALNVKQEAEKYRNVYENLSNDMDNMVTDEEIHVALERSHPLTLAKWESMFDEQGRLNVTVHETKDFIFHGGCENNEVRRQVWLFLLGVYPWDSSKDEREQLLKSLESIYFSSYKNLWFGDQVPSDMTKEHWKDEVFKIDKDVKRNDRHLNIYKHNTETGKLVNSDDQEMDSEVDDSNWVIINPHLNTLKSILMSYNVYNPDLGYCQGMTDLLSPIYYILQDEVLSFWAFVNFMDRMERNFLTDQSGIKEQMLTLAELTQLMLPDLMKHLTECDSSNLFFCFRMILVWFKRDFQDEQIWKIWEIFWTDYYSSQFQLFFMLAILQKNSLPVINNLKSFDDILKYFNDLKDLDWEDLMVRAELLFIKFQKIVAFVDGQNSLISDAPANPNTTGTGTGAEANIPIEDKLTKLSLHDPKKEFIISDRLRTLLSKRIIIQREKKSF
ncbi:related to GTPase-activating protein GYP7 [Saccharomycodes ludwigii]|uniref:Related to GTPase-activating protein GYP7 n=1 Tax=Saccharomycodes ludwigii TaxID=36035 RepID=A0A376B5B4_9ASCO|nr:hypothetical protein SCDLUD_003015 [Saccharomycodes ludwigii]KAH3901519.1 hypothetical protein SCDLUD_003015 [Saccharomycodes ludwigii]SSD59779.1 related to GTPase-activating protein GYP7 [Saccharomycodes ludwigii]